jgi:hypothetical protein
LIFYVILGSLGTRIVSIVIAASEIGYAGGSVSLLTPIVVSLLEFGMMTPIIGYYAIEGRSDVILNTYNWELVFSTSIDS